MSIRLLIDAIVQQTTVLVAQLSTSGGVRSPLAHVADQVFLSLAEEIERQGVGRKVVVDMFGLALRSYQRKVQRLTESGSMRDRTLWKAVLECITTEGPVRRSRLLERFARDEEASVLAVAKDLVSSGLAYSSGRGLSSVYGATTAADRAELQGIEETEAFAMLLWGKIFRTPGISEAELLRSANGDAERVQPALRLLLNSNRVSRAVDEREAALNSAPFVIPRGSEEGWEAAVFDHYQAVATAIIAKLQRRGISDAEEDLIGGSTLHFGIHAQHPFRDDVLASLKNIRSQLNDLWERVRSYNEQHPMPDDETTRVTLYVGQNVRSPEKEVL